MISRRQFVFSSAAAAFSRPLFSGTGAWAFLDTNLITMLDEKIIEHQSVIVRGGRIESIGSSGELPIPEDAVPIPASGLFLMPGLADMHVHLQYGNPHWENDLFLYVANGVTTIREMWGTYEFLRYRSLQAAGSIVAPRIINASPGMDGPPGRFGALTPYVTSEEQARRLVTDYQRAGYDFIKVYSDIAANVWRAALDQARSRNIVVSGHVPSRVGLEGVLNSSQATIEHCMGLAEACSPTGSAFSGEVSEERMDALAERVREAGIWNVPTIAVKLNSQDKITALESRREMRFVSPALRRWFQDPRTLGANRDITLYEANIKSVLRCLHRAGARLMLGVDSGFRHCIPGFSVHDELRLCVESGLTPFQALRLATTAPAAYLGRSDDTGTIRPGQIADLLLLEANPLDDIANAGRRAGVMLGSPNSTWLPEAWLQLRLEEIALAYAPDENADNATQAQSISEPWAADSHFAQPSGST